MVSNVKYYENLQPHLESLRVSWRRFKCVLDVMYINTNVLVLGPDFFLLACRNGHFESHLSQCRNFTYTLALDGATRSVDSQPKP